MTWCLAYVHPKALHCSGERGKGLGLSGGNSQGWPCPGKDSAVGVWHPKTIPGSPHPALVKGWVPLWLLH